jgi:hypothetical protein
VGRLTAASAGIRAPQPKVDVAKGALALVRSGRADRVRSIRRGFRRWSAWVGAVAAGGVLVAGVAAFVVSAASPDPTPAPPTRLGCAPAVPLRMTVVTPPAPAMPTWVVDATVCVYRSRDGSFAQAQDGAGAHAVRVRRLAHRAVELR